MYLEIILLILSVLTLASAALIFIGPSMADRLLGLSLMSSKLIMMIIIYALIKNKSFYVDIALIFSLLGFIGTIFIGNFILKKGKI